MATITRLAPTVLGTGTTTYGPFGAPGTANTINIGVVASTLVGTPTLDVKLQWSYDATVWHDPDVAESFVQITAVKQTTKQFPVRAPFYRIVAVMAGGTPNFTVTLYEYKVD